MLWLFIVMRYNNNKVLSLVSRCGHLGCRSRRLAHFDPRCFGDLFPRGPLSYGSPAVVFLEFGFANMDLRRLNITFIGYN